MSGPRILVTLAALVGLGLYVYIVELPKARQEAETTTLLNFEPDTVDTLTLTYPEREIRLRQTTAGEWDITAPIQAKADDGTVNNLVRTAASEEVSRSLTPDEGTDLALYGLAAPLVHLDIDLNDGTSLPRVSIGKDTPVGFSVYVQKEGDPQLHLTRQAFRLGMTKQIKELRDKALLRFDRAHVTKIAIATPEAETSLSKADTGWTLDTHAAYRVDDTAVQTYLSTVDGMRAEDFIERPLLEMSDFGLDPARLTLRLGLADEQTHTLRIGAEKSGGNGATQRYVKRDDREALYLMRVGILEDLSKTVNYFRDKTVADIAADAVHTLRVSRPDGSRFTISRGADAAWQIDQTADGTLKIASLEQFVNDLEELRGFEIAADDPDDLSRYGLATPAITLDIRDAAEQLLATILLGRALRDGTEQQFAMQRGRPTVYGLRDYVFARFDKRPEDFWEVPETDAGDSPPATDPSDTLDDSPREQEL